MEKKREKIVELLSKKVEWSKRKWEKLNEKEQALRNTGKEEERAKVMELAHHYLTIYTTTENILADVLRVLDGKI